MFPIEGSPGSEIMLSRDISGERFRHSFTIKTTVIWVSYLLNNRIYLYVHQMPAITLIKPSKILCIVFLVLTKPPNYFISSVTPTPVYLGKYLSLVRRYVNE